MMMIIIIIIIIIIVCKFIPAKTAKSVTSATNYNL
jgi:hypothetical protein